MVNLPLKISLKNQYYWIGALSSLGLHLVLLLLLVGVNFSHKHLNQVTSDSQIPQSIVENKSARSVKLVQATVVSQAKIDQVIKTIETRKEAVKQQRHAALVAQQQAKKKLQMMAQKIAEKKQALQRVRQNMMAKKIAEKKRQRLMAKRRARWVAKQKQKKIEQALAYKKAAQKKKKLAEQALLAEKSRQDLLQQSVERQLHQERQHSVKRANQQKLMKAVQRYRAMIIQTISQNWLVPKGVDHNLSCRFRIAVTPNGQVLSVRLLKSSGNMVLDRSAQTAVMKASPLPVPEDPVLFKEFRQFDLTVRPLEGDLL